VLSICPQTGAALRDSTAQPQQPEVTVWAAVRRVQGASERVGREVQRQGVLLLLLAWQARDSGAGGGGRRRKREVPVLPPDGDARQTSFAER